MVRPLEERTAALANALEAIGESGPPHPTLFNAADLLRAQGRVIEAAEDRIRDMLDFASGFCGPLTEAERLERINVIGNEALAAGGETETP